MRNKIKLVFFAFIGFTAFGQPTIHSPFSSYGFGERNYSNDAVSAGLGYATISYIDSTLINFANPAAYNALAKGQPLFSLGLKGRVYNMEQNTSSNISGYGMVEHFSMAFTLKKHFGLAFGLKPYSKRGYELTSVERVGADSVRYTYIGSGGANEAFLGLSSTVIKLKGTHLSVGTNLGYLFGSALNERRSSIVTMGQPSGGVDRKSVRFKSFHYEIGTYLRQNIGKNQNVIVAAVIEPAQNISAFRDESLFAAFPPNGNVNNPNTYSLLYVNSNVEGTIRIAPTFTTGLNYSLRFKTLDMNSRDRLSEVQLHFNYSATDWSRYSATFDGQTESNNFLASNRISIGLQFTPETRFIENSVNTNFGERLRYRAGYYMFNLPYAENGTQVKENGITFGFGMPIAAQQALSSLNLGVTLGTRGSQESSGLKENFIGINFGVIVAPSFYDRWFKKRKLD
jgi:hypothetical protein